MHEIKRFETSDERREFKNGYVDLVTLGGKTILRGTFEPGWSWHGSVRPIVGGEYCEVSHLNIILQGEMQIWTRDGVEFSVSQGDVLALEPGHDAWVVGDEAVIAYDMGEIAGFGKS